MNNAPERIWIDGDETGLDGFCDWSWVRGSWNRSKEGVGEVEYIRADLVEALEAENLRLREALVRMVDELSCDDPDCDICATARAALTPGDKL